MKQQQFERQRYCHMPMKLIGSNSSPYVRKVRVVMAEKKLDYEYVLEDVWSAGTTIGAASPLGKVPCLVMEGGEAVFDSRVIVEYLDTLSPVGKLIPSVGRERAGVKTWEAMADGVPGGHLGWAHGHSAQPSLDRPPIGQSRCGLAGHEQRFGRQNLLRRYSYIVG